MIKIIGKYLGVLAALPFLLAPTVSGAGKLYQEVLNKDSINTYLNYKSFLDKHGPKYSWWPS